MSFAARVNDMHICPLATPAPHAGGPLVGPGAITVLIGGMPAARMGDILVCNGPADSVLQGSATVLIEGVPAARMGDATAHGGSIVSGCTNVIIGG